MTEVCTTHALVPPALVSPIMTLSLPGCPEAPSLEVLRPSEALHLLQSAVEQASEAVMITDALLDRPGPHILYVNPAFLEMTGYAACEVLGQTPRILQGPETDPLLLRWLRHCLREGIPFHGQGINYRKGSLPYHAEWRITPVRSGAGEVTHFMATLRDITEHKRSEKQIGDQLARIHEYSRQLEAQKTALEEANTQLLALATTDGLTGLRNHREFHAQMEHERERAARDGTALSLVLLDVDRFKQYNDTFGNPAGDEVLKALASLLRGQARTVDLVARYGGEEFAVLLPGADAGGAGALAERLRTAVAGHAWPARPVTVSLGVATVRAEEARGREALPLLDQADKALYHSKAAGRDRVTHFEEFTGVTILALAA